MRCLHMDQSGWQCPAEAVEGGDFCADHYTISDPEMAEEKGRIPHVYRLAAFLLLLIFLFNAYQTIRQWLGR